MKYFLDTNLVILLFEGNEKKLKKQTLQILDIPNTKLFASAISLNEIVQLVRKKRLEGIDYEKYNSPEKILNAILAKTKDVITFLPYEPKYAKIIAKIEYAPKHNDPNDLSIIAHAIGKKLPIITTDRVFPYYEQFGAKIILNQL